MYIDYLTKRIIKIHGARPSLFKFILILLLTVSGGIMAAIPTSKAQTAASPLPTYAFLAVSPNPAGINQQVTIEMWLGEFTPTTSGLVGSRWQDFMVAIAKPDGTTQTIGPFTANDAAFYVTTSILTKLASIPLSSLSQDST